MSTAKRRAEVPADTAETAKRYRSAIDESCDELTCPITQALPVDPVLAEDGKIYERAAVSDWLKNHQRSPVTNLPMGAKLVAASQIKNLIEKMVRSGAVPDEKAAEWKQQIEQQEAVNAMRRKAEGGDTTAAYQLGLWYTNGRHGLSKDEAMAVRWFKQAAEARNRSAMTELSHAYMRGRGVDKNYAVALRWAAAAEALGSLNAKLILGRFYLEGLGGMPVDKEEGFRLFAQGCEAGTANSRAWLLLGSMYEQGTGTAIDMEKAAAAIRRAVAFNNPPLATQGAREWLAARGLEA